MKKKTNGDSPGTASADTPLEGTARNAFLVDLASRLVGQGINRDSVELLLLLANEDRCRPPLPTEAVTRIAMTTLPPLASQADEDRSPSDSTVLVGLVLRDAEDLFHSSEGEAFVTIIDRGVRQTWQLHQASVRGWHAQRFFNACGHAVHGGAIEDAVVTLAGKALYEGAEIAVHTRVAGRDGRIYLDLCNEEWEAVEIDQEGWRVVKDPPVRFRRPSGMLALPRPQLGGRLSELRLYLNLRDDDDLVLIVCWLVNALWPTGPYLILIFQSEQGTAKTTNTRVLRLLVDPNVAAIRSTPYELRDLVIAAKHNLVMAFDNLSHLKAWLQDALCRLATGGGFGKRQNYTDQDEVLIDVQRPVILNGIEVLATRADLLDRAITIEPPRIPDERRIPEATFWATFEEARPRILGALLNALVASLRNAPSVQRDRLPRMADFTIRGIAAEPALGVPEGTFERAYEKNRAAAVETTIEASPIGPEILRLVREKEWHGTAAQLLVALGKQAGPAVSNQPGWPRTPLQLSNALRRIALALSQTGIHIERRREGKRGDRMITLSPIVEGPHRQPRLLVSGDDGPAQPADDVPPADDRADDA